MALKPLRNRAHMRLFLARATAGLLAFGWGCGEPTQPPAPVATVSISPAAVVELVPGGAEMLTIAVKDAAGNTLTGRIASWTTSDPSKVSVAAGLVTGVGLGTATITASVEGRTATVEVVVKDGVVVSAAGGTFTVQGGAVALNVPAGGVSQTRSLTVVPAASPPANVRLLAGTAFDFGPSSTTFPAPVTITIKYDASKIAPGSPESGLLLYEVVGGQWRAVTGSTVNVSDKTVSGNVTRFGTYAVLMRPTVETVAVGGDLSPIAVGTTRQFTATLKDDQSDVLSRPVAWTSSNPAVLTIDAASGLATPGLPGSATVTATSEGKSATAAVTVVPGPPARLVANAGDGQSATSGSAVATPPSVKVTDAAGNAISGIAVTFAVASGGGSITGGSATTNAEGVATVGSWTLGATAGPNTLTATSAAVAGATVTFTAAGGVGAAAVITANTGNNQSATAGAVVVNPPSVKITDANNNPIAGFVVTFAPAAGSGTVTAGTATSNALGIATVGSWRLGSTPGPQSLTATAAGLTGSPITFSATAIAPVPATLTPFAGNNQTASRGRAVATPPSVRITDPAGIPVPGFTVTFAVVLGGGTVTGGSAITNENGLATVGSWTLGPGIGENSLTATAGTLSGSPFTFNATSVAVPTAIAANAGDNQTATAGSAVSVLPSVKITDIDGAGVAGIPVTFTASGVAGPASIITAFAGNNQTAITAGEVGTPPSVRITDANNNPVAGATVTFTPGGGGSVTGGTATSNGNGIAAVGSWRLGSTPGPQTLTAASAGLSGSPVTFNATAIAQPPVAIAVNAGDNQSALANSAVPIRPSVIVTDAQGRGVPNVSVVFSIRSGAGSITGANAVTNASGIATVGSWVLGIGSNSLSATVEGLAGNPVIFVALGQAEVQIVTFGDSNTDLGFAGTDPSPRVASYVSNENPAIRLGPNAANSTLQLAGKIEARWRASRPNKTLKAVNHGISGTSTGTGRNIFGSPHARESVGGVTRFQGEALGVAYPWNGGEPFSSAFPDGPVLRVQAFTPRTSDFLYISMGTNDLFNGTSPAAIEINLEAMIDDWTARGLPASRVMITTLPPRRLGAESERIPELNGRIRTLAQRKGVLLINLSGHVSDNDGLTWKAAALHVNNDFLHYSESVRDWLADQVVSCLLYTSPSPRDS